MVFGVLLAAIGIFACRRYRRTQREQRDWFPPAYSENELIDIAAKEAPLPPQELPQRGSIVELQSNAFHELHNTEVRDERVRKTPAMTSGMMGYNVDEGMEFGFDEK